MTKNNSDLDYYIVLHDYNNDWDYHEQLWNEKMHRSMRLNYTMINDQIHQYSQYSINDFRPACYIGIQN